MQTGKNTMQMPLSMLGILGIMSRIILSNDLVMKGVNVHHQFTKKEEKKRENLIFFYFKTFTFLVLIHRRSFGQMDPSFFFGLVGNRCFFSFEAFSFTTP